MEDENKVSYSFKNTLPAAGIQQNLPILARISWKYNSSKSNGLPDKEEESKMVILEKVIQNNIIRDDFCFPSYNRTGNGLKGFTYYIKSADDFLEALTDAAEDQPPFPIDINFYDDPEWKDLKSFISDFSKSDN